MIDQDTIISKLRQVIDPEIGLNIVDLGMIRNVNITGGQIEITVALTVRGCPLANTIESDITNSLKGINGIETVSVTMTSMGKDELEALGAKLQKMRSEQKAVGKAPGLSAGIDKLERKGMQNIIAVMSGKGGVGKSFVTAILATQLRREGYEVGILDADITGPSIAKIFGLSGKPLADQNGILPKTTTTGIKVMSMNLLLDTPETPVIWRGPIINGVIRQLFTDVNWGDLHFLLVDLPPGTGDAPLTVFQSLPVDSVVIVTTPQDLAMLIVKKALNMAKQMNVKITGMVENMSYLTCPHCSETIRMFEDSDIETVANSLGIDFLGRLPFDPKINRLADRGLIEEYLSPSTSEFVRKVRSKARPTGEIANLPIAWKKQHDLK